MEIFIMLTWMWLAVGFLSGVKLVFIDKTITNELLHKMYDDAKTPSEKRVIVMISRKRNVLVIATLMGFVALYMDILGTIKDIKRSWQAFKHRNKNNK